MKLTVIERISLASILPNEGNFITLKIVRKLREDLSFDEAELKKLSFKQSGTTATWNAEAEPKEGKEISIGEKATDLIVEALKKLDKDGKLIQQHVSLYEKFIKE